MSVKNYIGFSILSSDFYNIKNVIKKINNSFIDFIHLDIMDGVFVPNITFGSNFIKDIRPYTNKIFDVHLMITNPENYINNFIEAGADRIWIHIENKKSFNIIKELKNKNIWCGLVINAKTPVNLNIKKYLKFINGIMIMTVNAGFGGQTFIPEMIEKIKFINSEIKKLNSTILIQVDGGINNKTLKIAKENGANSFVVGSYLTKQQNFNKAVQELKNI